MLKEERLQLILDKLNSQRKVLSSELSQELQVSEDTIRRDLNELSENGLLQKVHGGALPKSLNPAKHSDRIGFAQEDKQVLATKSMRLFENGQLIILDGGTTNLQVARLLPPDLKATVFTNDLPIATLLINHPLIEVVLIGGRLVKSAQLTIGMEAVETLRGIRADICLLGICSIHPTIGVTIPDREEVPVKKAMVRAAARVVTLATSIKLNTVEHYVVCPYDSLDTLITDDKAEQATLALYRSQGVEVW
jgi:DeoR/GlpR family transcriptional regulator of sugar metabolism